MLALEISEDNISKDFILSVKRGYTTYLGEAGK
jgi:hypothetical protein